MWPGFRSRITEAVFQGQIPLTWQNEALFLITIWFNSSSSCRGLEPEPWQHAISSGGVDNEKDNTGSDVRWVLQEFFLNGSRILADEQNIVTWSQPGGLARKSLADTLCSQRGCYYLDRQCMELSCGQHLTIITLNADNSQPGYIMDSLANGWPGGSYVGILDS